MDAGAREEAGGAGMMPASRSIALVAAVGALVILPGCGAALPNDLRKQQIEQQKRTNVLLEKLIRIEEAR